MTAEHLTETKLYMLLGLVSFFGIMLTVVGFVIIKSLTNKAEAKNPANPEHTKSEQALPPVEEPPRVLTYSSQSFWGRLQSTFTQKTNPELADLEEILYTSDLGTGAVQKLLRVAESDFKNGAGAVREKMRSEVSSIFSATHQKDLVMKAQVSGEPAVWMIVGINGAGKTTSIGKLSAQFAAQGLKVLVAAGDTFRAAAGAQLKVWTERAQVEIFSPEGVSDPSAVAFDAVAKAKARGYDLVLIDTAGRLTNQSHLMDELKKVKRVVTKLIPNGPAEILVVLDANNGQNALTQAREFNQALGLTGVILTKMDSTAKGGVAVGVCEELKIPIRFIGVGEKINDLRPFSREEYLDSIFGEMPSRV
jgi:fused signal recognition particle receptor